MSGVEVAMLVMNVLPPAIEYFFARDAVSMDEGDNGPLPPGSKAPRIVFQNHAIKSESPRARSRSRHKFVEVTSLCLDATRLDADFKENSMSVCSPNKTATVFKVRSAFL